MQSLAITDVDAVRTEGSLADPSVATGAATDRQIQRAIRDAMRRMKEKIGNDLYVQVRDYSEGDLAVEANDDQHEAFLHAEACFAIAALAPRLNAQQLGATGLIQSVEIGKARQSFGNVKEVDDLARGWMTRGMQWLSKYVSVPLDDITKKPTSFASRKGSFYVGAI